jgi:predicted peptidase
VIGASARFRRTLRRTAELSYLLYQPRAAAAEKKAPLVLFLHGMGERGSDLSLVAVHGPPLLAEQGRTFPYWLAAPQCPARSSWFFQLDALRELLRDLVRRHPIDTSRIYLTGLSMGGFGSWHLAVENPKAFAAVLPICGGEALASGLEERLPTIAHVPVWAFHGAQDTVVPLILQQYLVDSLKKAGGSVRFTVYPEADHDSWTATYDDPKVTEWMLAQRNRGFRL